MNTTIDRRLRWDVDILGLFALIAFMFFELGMISTGLRLPVWQALAFGAGGGLIATILLKPMGYFDCLRILPRKSDFLLMVFSMEIGAAVMFEGVTHLFDDPVMNRWVILAWTPLIGLLTFAGHYAHAWSSTFYRHKRRRVVLKLQPHEVSELMAVFRLVGLDRNIQVLTPGEFRRELKRSSGAKVDLVVFSRGAARAMEQNKLLVRAHLAGIPIIDRRALIANLTGRIFLRDADTWSFLSSARPQTDLLRFVNFLKSLIEPVIAALLLVIFSPVYAVVAVLVKFTSPGPVIYSQKRAGYLGRTFRLHKFRSMRTDSEANGAQWAVKNDPRITPVGRFIRKTRLDELPQLWNVVRGEMSFIGPRPERPEIYRELRPSIPLFTMRTQVRPGITGWAQVCAGYAATVDESRLKLEHDLFYIQHMSPRIDLIVIAKTVKVMLFGSEHIETREALAVEHSPENPLERIG